MPTWSTRALPGVERFGDGSSERCSLDGSTISHLAEEFGTPMYLYHAESIVQRIERTRAALGREVEVLYSIKANSSLGVCRLIAGTGLAGAEIASAGELVLALAAGFAPQDIVFAGPGKTDAELERAVLSAVYAVNVESVDEIDRLADIARSRNRTIGVGLRINPDAQLTGSQMRMGGTASQFGLDQADLGEAIARVRAHPALRLRGIHVYTATQVFDTEALLEHCRHVLEIGLDAADRVGEPIEMIDLGGGFGVPYFDGMAEFDVEGFGRDFQQLLQSYRSDPRLLGCRVLFELGRYLVAEAGIYVMRVIDVKRSRGKIFVVTDGGMHHHSAATGNFGSVFRKAYSILNLSREVGANDETVAVVGPCCTPLDSFGSSLQLARPMVGDLISVLCSGAYGYSASKLAFLSHPTPAEVLLWDGEAHVLRRAGQPEDVLRGQEVPPPHSPRPRSCARTEREWSP